MEKSLSSNYFFRNRLRLKGETRIALTIALLTYVIFSIVKVAMFPQQNFAWHAITALIGLVFIIIFGVILFGIDRYMESVIPFEKNAFKRICIQFALSAGIILLLRQLASQLFMDKLPIKLSNDMIVAGMALNIFMILSLILSMFAYRFFMGWKQEKILAAELDREKALVQYDNLKNQLNPHFLFNSLTSLNSLIFENPQLASEFLQQLSKVYRYVLDHKEKNLVSIDTEIQFVKHYVQLMKARFESGIEVKFEVDEEALQKAIVPVTLQVLIENAVKHNSVQKTTPLNIRIFNNGDFLSVENNLQKKSVMETSNGQGLGNLKNLYRFLSPIELSVEQNDKSFTVKIPLLEL